MSFSASASGQPVTEIVDMQVNLELNLNQALLLLQVLAHVRTPKPHMPTYKYDAELRQVSKALYSILGEEDRDHISCIETDRYGAVDIRVIEEFALEMNIHTIKAIEEHKNKILDHANKTGI